MASIVTPSLTCLASTTIKKVRELPVLGKITVKKGDRVSAEDIVATGEIQGDLIIVRIAEQLGIEPFEVIKGIKIKQGEHAKKGTLLCEHKGLFGIFRSKYFSPEEGIVELISEKTGHLGLRLPSRNIHLSAFIAGTVTEIAERKSVTIEGKGAFIQGIFGVGGERAGTFHQLAVKSDQVILPEHIPANAKGMILAGGAAATIEAIRAAAAAGAVGMVVGSIDDQTLAAYLGFDLGIALTGNEDLPMTLIVSEGFGKITMSEQVTLLITEFNGLPASINGATQVRAGALRPEIFIPHDKQQDAAAEAGARSLHIGAKIRGIRVPYFGEIMKVVEMPTQAAVIETGAEVRVLKAERNDCSVVMIPRANVELL
jgi:hypothetical protein